VSFESGPQFLKEKYKLHNQPEVGAAVQKAESTSDEPVSQDPVARIEAYLSRLGRVLEPEPLPGHEGFDRKGRNLSVLKAALYKGFVIKPEEVPESYWNAQARLAREQGHGNIEITQVMRAQGTEVIIADQESSLDSWIDYLASDDATYPLWLKYFAIRGVLGMSTYDKENHRFNRRDTGTTSPFPDLDREALSYVLDTVEKRQGLEYAEASEKIRQVRNEIKRLKGEYRSAEKQEIETESIAQEMSEAQNHLERLLEEQARLVSKGLNIPEEARTELVQLLQAGDFARLYAWAIEKAVPGEENELLTTEGRWVKYDCGSDHAPLVRSLQGHGTGWCTAGESTAKAQLEAGDFYVYYSNDRHGNPTVPRAAIRMQENQIAEVRGIAAEQNLDPHIAKTVQEKVREFADGEKYEKKALDMRLLTHVERKAKAGQQLDKDDLAFLYEINGPIEGFGYKRDPRIQELRDSRDPNSDAPVMLECAPEQIACNSEEIDINTRAYIGPLEEGILEALQAAGVEHIYSSFPESPVRFSELVIGGGIKEQMVAELTSKNIIISHTAQRMLDSNTFTLLPESEIINLVHLQVGSLGLSNFPTVDEIWKRAEELGLELCPPETALLQRVKDINQPLGDFYRIAMKPINDGDEYPHDSARIFELGHDEEGLLLSTARFDSFKRMPRLDFQLVFRLAKSPQEV